MGSVMIGRESERAVRRLNPRRNQIEKQHDQRQYKYFKLFSCNAERWVIFLYFRYLHIPQSPTNLTLRNFQISTVYMWLRGRLYAPHTQIYNKETVFS